MDKLKKDKKRQLKAHEIIPLIVGFPLYDGVTLTDFSGPTDVFNFTNGFIKPIWLAAEKRPIITSSGTFVFPNYSFKETHPHIDILFVPGGSASDVINNAMFNKEFQSFIKSAASGAQWTGSVCVGAFILAAAGLLNNCTVTTYWSQLNNLRLLKSYCSINIPDGYPRGIIDEKQKRFTGGGVSSSLDLALMLVKKIKGKKLAESSQLYMQYSPDPPAHAGNPTQAPESILKQVLINQAAVTRLYYDAVQRLMNST